MIVQLQQRFLPNTKGWRTLKKNYVKLTEQFIKTSHELNADSIEVFFYIVGHKEPVFEMEELKGEAIFVNAGSDDDFIFLPARYKELLLDNLADKTFVRLLNSIFYDLYHNEQEFAAYSMSQLMRGIDTSKNNVLKTLEKAREKKVIHIFEKDHRYYLFPNSPDGNKYFEALTGGRAVIEKDQVVIQEN